MNHKIVLHDAYKGYIHDQDKILSPDVTVRRFKGKLKRIDLDILEKTVRIDNGRLDIPVFFSICGKDAKDVIGTRKQMGKGGTPHQAEASAVMELAERYSLFSFWKKEENFFIDEYRNLKEKAIPFESIAMSVHDRSSDLGPAEEIFSSLPLKWVWAYNLSRGEEVLIPFDWFYAINEFNGSCAGNCQEEALIQGICEVIERHVSSIISRNRMKTASIDMNSVTDTLVLLMLQKYRKRGIRLFISDFSLDTGIPSVGVLAFDPSTFPEKSEIVWTAGTTPNPQKALSRALSEVAQLAGDFNTCSNYVPSGLPKFSLLHEAEFVMTSERKIGIHSLPDLSDDNMRVEVERCVSVLSEIGMEVLVLNITHPLLQIPAFYTIIPGAHFRERAMGTSVGMFSAKLIAQNADPHWAIARLKKMNDLLPGKYYVWFYLGISHLSMHSPEKAIRYLEEALRLDPYKEDIASIYSYLAQCRKEMGQFKEAIADLKRGEVYDNHRTDIYNLMGFCYFKLKDHEEAIRCFKKVLEIDPTSALDYANIAANYRDMGNREQAIHYYRIALDFDPALELALSNLRKLSG